MTRMTQIREMAEVQKKSKRTHQANRQQLNYIRRDLQIVRELQLVSDRSLSPKQQQYLKVIEELYYQQITMYDNKVHKIEHRIVSIHQQWVRPIVRGKATANVEFGAKISISMTDGYSMIENADYVVVKYLLYLSVLLWQKESQKKLRY